MATQGSRIASLVLFGLLLLAPVASLAEEKEQVATPEGEEGDVTTRGTGDLKMQRQLSPEVINKLSQLPMPGPAPTNLTVTVVTPTNLRIEWSPSPGAVRYLISRNGAPDITIEANAGFLQGSRFLYLDAGRKPATLHTYSVTAQFNPPLLPARSTAVQILTPPALPPSNFRASVSGPNAVTLTWTGRPEANSYRIIRNGGGLPATVLNATGGLGHVDQNLPPGEYSYLIYSVIRLADGEELHGEFSNPVTVKTRPFNIIALGDSVMWGQGLSDAHKFRNKVGEWLKTSLGKSNVLVHWTAHSGAVTYPVPGETATETDILPGEVPSHYPSIGYQITNLAQTKVEPVDVDLVLVDGCINNVGVTTILNPFTSENGLRDATRSYCTAGMQNILSEVGRKFVNAKVVVNGYFPIVSRLSDLSSVVALLMGVGVVTAGLIPPDPIFGGAVTAGFRERAAVLSDLFFQESTSSLQLVANGMNSLPPPLGGRFRYASLSVGPDNAYAAPNSWLWLIPARGIVEDEAFNGRSRDCQTFQKTDLLCYGASMGHPNVKGAQAYTNAITSVITQFLPEWRAAHVTSLPSVDDALTVKVQPVAGEPGGGTMIVTASDGPSGPTMQGTVHVNGAPAGVLGAQIRYAYQQSNPTDILVRVDVPGHRPRSFTIPVRTQSIMINLTNNGDPRTAIVTATDAVTGQPLSGTVTLNPASPKQVVGATGQPVTYPSCGQITSTQQFKAFTLSAGPVPCGGTVRVSFYPEAAFQDIPGAMNVGTIQGTIQLKNDNLPQIAPPIR